MTDTTDNILGSKEAAAYLGLDPDTLGMWRWRGRGPAYCKIGIRKIGYRKSDLDAFLAVRRVEPEAPHNEAAE